MEREELRLILASGLLARSPNLEKLLNYICERYWEGKPDQLKEYNLGVEALGRSPDFDPASNAIVRVEVHRLREKLKKFYENGGADHAIVIRLQPGGYVPQFIWRSEGQNVAGPQGGAVDSSRQENSAVLGLPAWVSKSQSLTGSEKAAVSAGAPQKRRLRGALTLFLSAIALAAAVIISIVALRRTEPIRTVAPAAATKGAGQTSALAARRPSVRIIAGYSKQSYIDRSGNEWQGDAYFTGGGTGQNPDRFIHRTSDPTLFQTYRQGEFSYNVPLKPGNYELWLYFVESAYGPGTLLGGGETSRLFTVQVNGRTLLDPFDVLADAGGNFIADVRVFKNITPATDGDVHIRFLRRVGNPFVNAIKLIPAPPGRMRTLRIVAQDGSYTDHGNHVWSPDTYFNGGQMVARHHLVSGTAEPGLFEGERYGNFNYAIPVATGKYSLTLYFAERYFGPEMPGGGGAGSRVFNVTCNDRVLLRDFDILKAAHAANRAVVETFHGLQANAQGKLIIRFEPVVNYPLVDAIEVADESR